ncbi:hypothetical protein F5B18DRAFT_610351 [Nemania serpens]|nr:hypothetical protein F5B18DRAFT_610351 [Nemania serpens]
MSSVYPRQLSHRRKGLHSRCPGRWVPCNYPVLCPAMLFAIGYGIRRGLSLQDFYKESTEPSFPSSSGSYANTMYQCPSAPPIFRCCPCHATPIRARHRQTASHYPNLEICPSPPIQKHQTRTLTKRHVRCAVLAGLCDQLLCVAYPVVQCIGSIVPTYTM